MNFDTLYLYFLILIKARFRPRTFHEPNLIRINVDPNYLERQTPILIAAELSLKGGKTDFGQTAYKIRLIIYALGSVHEKFGVRVKAVPKSLQRRNSRKKQEYL